VGFDYILKSLTNNAANIDAVLASSPTGKWSITQFDPCSKLKKMARPVVKRSNARSTGKFPSWNMNRMIEFESLIELAAFVYLECNPSPVDHCSHFVEGLPARLTQACHWTDLVTNLHYPYRNLRRARATQTRTRKLE
jgi:hypothetical protein